MTENAKPTKKTAAKPAEKPAAPLELCPVCAAPLDEIHAHREPEDK